MSKEDIKWKLQVIFVYYTSYADRNNFKLLKRQNYRRFLIDSETIKTESSLVHFDIAFQKINTSAIIYKDFLKLIPEISELVFKKLTRTQAFNQYIHRNIEPLYSEIISKSEFGQDIGIALNTQIDVEIEKKLLKITITERAFNEYIALSINGKEILRFFEGLTCFLKDFEVCPHIVSKSLLYVVFLSLMKDKGENEAFYIEDFVKVLMIIAEVSSRKISTQELCSNGKIIKLLERMEISSGFDKISKKIMYETAISPSFLKSFNDFQYEEDQFLDKTMSRMYPSGTRHRNCNESFDGEHHSGKKEIRDELKIENYHTVERLMGEESAKLSKDFKELKYAFEDLCEFGEVANSKTLKSLKMKKLFERIGLISIVGQAWLDIQIVNLQRGSESGKIELPQFLELLSLTSKKINASFDEITGLVIRDHEISKKNNIENGGESFVFKEYNEGEQALLKEIIQCCEKQAEKIYKKFIGDIQNLLGFAEFSKMMYEFEIFPTIISKNKLYQIFSTLNDVREETSPIGKRKAPRVKEVESYLKDSKKIDFSGFLMGLVEVGQEICDDSLEAGQKLIVLLEKINESEGYKKLGIPSLVSEVRKRFGKYYVKSFQKEEEHTQTFDELLLNFS